MPAHEASHKDDSTPNDYSSPCQQVHAMFHANGKYQANSNEKKAQDKIEG